MKLDTRKTDIELKEDAKSHGLKISFLSDYSIYPEHCTPSTLLVNYSGIEPDLFRKAMGILEIIL